MITIDDFQNIYTSYANTVKQFLLCQTHNYDLAEELTQETFYQAYKSIHRYNGTCKMSVWLCQIAKHLFYDYLKYQKKYPPIAEHKQEDILLEVVSKDMGIEEQFLLKEEANTVKKEITKLKEPYQKILLLRAISELSFREIGELFQKNENWARVTYYRAKVLLLERLEKHGIKL